MSDLDFVDYIYDPVWKNIPITQLEKEIIETDIFKRLMNIKQMSLASISFSGANHTRYEHSIGTMHVAYLIASKIDDLKENANNIFLEKFKLKNGYAKTLQFIRIAGLLHDLGHPPFSHAIEWVFERNPELYLGEEYSHDIYTYELIKGNEEIKQILKDEIISSKNISDFLARKLENLPKPIAILYPLLNGDLDFDKIDYIIRDNYHCGLPANIDIYSIMDSFKINILKQEEDGEISDIGIMFKTEKLHVVENLLHSRKLLITIIQQERKNRIANQMLMSSAQKFLKKRKNCLNLDEYKKLAQDLHEKWNDYDLVTNINQEFKGNKNSNYLERALKGKLLDEIVKINFSELTPSERLDFYIFDSFKNKRSILEKNLNKKMKSDFLVDFVFIKPPPLTIRLIPDQKERLASKEYLKKTFSYALHSKSNIINGILKDSYKDAFIAIYSEKNSIDLTILIKNIKKENRIQNNAVRKELIDKNELLSEDLILLVLAAIRKLYKNKLKMSRLWITGVERFQKFLYNYIKSINFNCPSLDFITEDYSSKFDSLMTKLVILGLVDQRNKHVSLKTEKGKDDKIKYIDRNDYTMNMNGEEYVDNLPIVLLNFRDNLYEKMVENLDLYLDYFARDFNLQDVIKQKDIRPKFEEKGLPIVDI